jgi:hypothetical protein
MLDTTDWANSYKCKDGYICSGGNAKKIGSDTCPPDHYCVKGVPIECPAGTFIQIKGATSINECIECPPGKICPNHSVGMLDCPEGYYCDVGKYTSTDPAVAGFKVCPAGHYCPKGSF